ncbi:unnamed protein product [Candidula unifasciata]|uniref:Coiled-coil domain-containing protein 89 n=1 Tax=Candidula unifasciata TaxID=100452 RepID=A0A8S3ZT96_9EUPU|nr:unnamed protein product [Candidula unifasciata]
MTDIQDNINLLKALPEDAVSENIKLRSRIDEQCKLIMILKQRADEGASRICTLEKINEECMEFRDQADAILQTELDKYNLLEGRFNTLASNHEEMIRIKDEYKRVNQELREKNATLKEENNRLFSKAVAEKDTLILELEKKCSSFLERWSGVENKLRQSQIEWQSKEDELKRQITELQTNYSQQTKNLLAQLQNTEEKLKGTEYRLQQQLDCRHSVQEETSQKLQQLSKEKEELLTLITHRGKLVHKEQDENKLLKQRIETMERSVKNMENKFIQEAEAVNVNLRVKRLAEDLQEANYKYSQLVKEFEAFKKHSNDLLKKEKELNDRLRQLYT